MIYLILAIFFLVLFILQYNTRGQQLHRRIFWISSAVFFLAFALRGDNVGGDTLQYCLYFMGKHSRTYGSIQSNKTIEIGFKYFCLFLRSIWNTHFAFIFVTSIISICPVIYLCKKYASYTPLTYFYFICSDYLVMMVNYQTNIRQNMATGMILLAIIIYLSQPHKFKYYCIILLFLAVAFLLHTTSYILIPLTILLFALKIRKDVAIAIMALSVVLPIFFLNRIETLMFNIFTSSLFAGEAFNNITRYFTQDTHVTALMGKLGNLISNTFVSLWAIYNIYHCNKNELNNIFIKSMFLACVFSNLGQSFGLAFRMVVLFQVMSFIYVPQAIRKSKPLMVGNLLTLSIVYYHFIYTIFSQAYYNTNSHLLPYNFIWE